MSQTTIDFTVHQYEPQSTQAHLNENRPRFSEQCRLVYNHMVDHGFVTVIEAQKMGVTRLSARIDDLEKRNGIEINKDNYIKVGKTKVKSYSIKK